MEALTVAALIGDVLGGLAITVAVAIWGRERWIAFRRAPYNLGLHLDKAPGDPGHQLIVFNRRSEPVQVELWGVARQRELPRGLYPRIMQEGRVQSTALAAVSDMNWNHWGKTSVQPGAYAYLRTVATLDDAIPPDLWEEMQRLDMTDEEAVAQHESKTRPYYNAWSEPSLRYPNWGVGDALVPFVLIPGVGYIFGPPTKGPYTDHRGYRGFACRHCAHDYMEHHPAPVRAWRTFRMKGQACRACGCPAFRGEPPLPPMRERMS